MFPTSCELPDISDCCAYASVEVSPEENPLQAPLLSVLSHHCIHFLHFKNVQGNSTPLKQSARSHNTLPKALDNRHPPVVTPARNTTTTPARELALVQRTSAVRPEGKFSAGSQGPSSVLDPKVFLLSGLGTQDVQLLDALWRTSGQYALTKAIDTCSSRNPVPRLSGGS